MSWREVGTAIAHGERQRLPPADRFVLVLLGWYQHAELGQAWPSIPTLRRVSGLSRATIFRALARLVAGGILRRESRRGRGRTSRYQLAAVEKVSPRDLSGKGLTVRPPKVSPAPAKGRTVTPRSEKNRELNRERPRTVPTAPRPGTEPVPMGGVFTAVLAALEGKRQPRQGNGQGTGR